MLQGDSAVHADVQHGGRVLGAGQDQTLSDRECHLLRQLPRHPARPLRLPARAGPLPVQQVSPVNNLTSHPCLYKQSFNSSRE